MMTLVKLGRVKQIRKRRLEAVKDPVAQANVCMTPAVRKINSEQVKTNGQPMLPSLNHKGHEECGRKRANVNHVLVRILHKGRGRQRADGQVVEAMHGLHLRRHVQPTMDDIVQRLDDKDVTEENFEQARRQLGHARRKEQGGENDLEGNLCPHVHVHRRHVLVLLTVQLLLRELLMVVVLINENIMEREHHVGEEETKGRNSVERSDRSNFVEYRRQQEDEPVIA